jgi:Holliday junction DNA helicase RuvA
MICGLEGILEWRGDDSVILNVGGVSFRVYVPASTLSTLDDVGNTVKLHTHLQVKEDSLTLYGFSSTEELELFQLLISVSGVGPKIALALLSALRPEQVIMAITSGNAEMLSRVPGVGQKMAARLVVELKGKLPHIEVAPPLDADVLAALTSLGYSMAEATRALASIPDSPDLPLEDRLKIALQHLSKG